MEHSLRAWHNTSTVQQTYPVIRGFVQAHKVIILAQYFYKIKTTIRPTYVKSIDINNNLHQGILGNGSAKSQWLWKLPLLQSMRPVHAHKYNNMENDGMKVLDLSFVSPTRQRACKNTICIKRYTFSTKIVDRIYTANMQKSYPFKYTWK